MWLLINYQAVSILTNLIRYLRNRNLSPIGGIYLVENGVISSANICL